MEKETVKTEGCRLLLVVRVSQFVGIFKNSINSYSDRFMRPEAEVWVKPHYFDVKRLEQSEFPVSALVWNNRKRLVSLCLVDALQLLCCCIHQQVSELVAYSPRKGNKLHFLELRCGLKIATLLGEEQLLYVALRSHSNLRIYWILCKKARKSSCETDAQNAASRLSVNPKQHINIITTRPIDCTVS
jgi:hypothetical protein